MERLLGKPIQTDGITEFVSDFVGWVGELTGNALLTLDGADMELEIVSERNADDHLVVARGLQGGGMAVAGWADSEGYAVLDDENDFISIEASPDDAPKTAAAVAAFLAPSGRWRVEELNARRKP